MFGSLVVLIVVWAVLTRNYDPISLGVGAASAALVLSVRNALFPHVRPLIPAPVRRPISLIRFLLALAGRVVLSTVHTSLLILFGGEEGRVVALPIRVTGPFAQLLLLNAITLTPSTISLLIEGDLLYIHWLKPRRGTGDWRKIKETLEVRIAELFGEGRDEAG